MQIELNSEQIDFIQSLIEMHLEGLSQWDNEYAKIERDEYKKIHESIEYQVNKENEWTIKKVV